MINYKTYEEFEDAYRAEQPDYEPRQVKRLERLVAGNRYRRMVYVQTKGSFVNTGTLRILTIYPERETFLGEFCFSGVTVEKEDYLCNYGIVKHNGIGKYYRLAYLVPLDGKKKR